jgi:hypothetical protein
MPWHFKENWVHKWSGKIDKSDGEWPQTSITYDRLQFRIIFSIIQKKKNYFLALLVLFIELWILVWTQKFVTWEINPILMLSWFRAPYNWYSLELGLYAHHRKAPERTTGFISANINWHIDVPASMDQTYGSSSIWKCRQIYGI